MIWLGSVWDPSRGASFLVSSPSTAQSRDDARRDRECVEHLSKACLPTSNGVDREAQKDGKRTCDAGSLQRLKGMGDHHGVLSRMKTEIGSFGDDWMTR